MQEARRHTKKVCRLFYARGHPEEEGQQRLTDVRRGE